MVPMNPTTPVRRGPRRLISLVAVIVALVAFAGTFTAADATPPHRPDPVTGVRHPAPNCRLRWLLHELFDIGTPCPPTVTTTRTTTSTSTTTTTRTPPPTDVAGAVVYGITSVADCGFRVDIPCGAGSPMSVLVEARSVEGGQLVASTRSDADGDYRLVVPADVGPVVIRIQLEMQRVAEQCTRATYTPEAGGVYQADLLCSYAIAYGTSVSYPPSSVGGAGG
jgi:hypothetical protein